MLIPMSRLLDWFARHHPDRTHRAGSLLFLDLPLAIEVIDRAESAGMSVEEARGFAVADGVATPIPGQHVRPSSGSLLDCETPSGASCGIARRTIQGQWFGDAPAGVRHMVILDVDETS